MIAMRMITMRMIAMRMIAMRMVAMRMVATAPCVLQRAIQENIAQLLYGIYTMHT